MQLLQLGCHVLLCVNDVSGMHLQGKNYICSIISEEDKQVTPSTGGQIIFLLLEKKKK